MEVRVLRFIIAILFACSCGTYASLPAVPPNDGPQDMGSTQNDTNNSNDANNANNSNDANNESDAGDTPDQSGPPDMPQGMNNGPPPMPPGPGTEITCDEDPCTKTCEDTTDGCSDLCPAGADCTFDCPGGGCRQVCEGDTCDFGCERGRCNMICRAGATCTFNCGGGCQFFCDPGSNCASVTCGNDDCVCNGPECP